MQAAISILKCDNTLEFSSTCTVTVVQILTTSRRQESRRKPLLGRMYVQIHVRTHTDRQTTETHNASGQPTGWDAQKVTRSSAIAEDRAMHRVS